jgi:hypothetical protein
MFIALLLFFQSLSPPTEGMQVLSHYMFGNGKDLVLKSDYLHKSPVILKRLKTMRVGETRRVAFKQSEDWRLSYAINGFSLTKTSDGFKIYQYIKFDDTGKVFTYINTPTGKIKIYDSWVHVKKCKPFKMYYVWKKKTLS